VNCIRHAWAGLGYQCGYLVGRFLPISITLTLLSAYTARFAPFEQALSIVRPETTSPAMGTDAPTLDQAIQELSDTFIPIKSPTVNLEIIN
jgi:hypothetical protein